MKQGQFPDILPKAGAQTTAQFERGIIGIRQFGISRAQKKVQPGTPASGTGFAAFSLWKT